MKLQSRKCNLRSPGHRACLVAGWGQVCVFRRDVTHIAPRNQVERRRRHRGRRWKALQSSSICHRVVGGDHELDCDGFVTVGADVDVMRSSREQPTSPPGAEVLRNADVIAIHENLGCGRCNIENQPAQGRGLHGLRRRLWLCWDGRTRLRCVEHHHRPAEVGGAHRRRPRGKRSRGGRSHAQAVRARGEARVGATAAQSAAAAEPVAGAASPVARS